MLRVEGRASPPRCQEDDVQWPQPQIYRGLAVCSPPKTLAKDRRFAMGVAPLGSRLMKFIEAIGACSSRCRGNTR